MIKSPINWIEAARPKTLPAAVAPVVLGSCICVSVGKFQPIPALLCLLVAITLQIACNFSNDYSDGIRGTDNERVGPKRLVASGTVSAKTMLKASLGTYSLSCIFGLILVIYTQKWWLILLGLLCIVAAWYYTGGKYPYGYRGYGEISVFVFFGLIATIGTTYLQTNTIPPVSISTAFSIGMLSTAMLMINNIRDIESDRKAGKHTLATKLGVGKSKALYTVLIILPLVIGITTFVYAKLAILTGVTGFLVLKILKIVLYTDDPKKLILALKYTGQLEILYALILGTAIALKPITG
ncbi:1,4-dihydroxy-2-naphthoate polyprenyltransferase [Actinomyces sp. zg-332]|uniref:1,4-dihydroxy-2-naphthoate polyprenyltransferase n=1 Tax=Actinomyces sp. zg-332 TaxID=2708340 RepID=UPI00141D89E3|nr:1,4-dihydroxy-2-naphthoate polyprenyltransferase [Actinomyces sp. zg-332]QPK94035.1 1,4-dihydroxy-2-naphthoate polyprenyltransferase [Actinomyces sp. zg-332]